MFTRIPKYNVHSNKVHKCLEGLMFPGAEINRFFHLIAQVHKDVYPLDFLLLEAKIRKAKK